LKGTFMAKVSAGLLMFRIRGDQPEVLLVHPGGPLWAKKDEGAWSIPKGEAGEGEELLAAAQREFEEETGLRPEGPFRPLRPIRQKSGKIVHAWAFEGDCEPSRIRSNSFTMEWPPRSGKQCRFSEIDRGDFFPLDQARKKLNPAQLQLLEDVTRMVGGGHGDVCPDGRIEHA
jgi:predicted NUDIX family NTP pyrophosphohydrolase